MAVRVVCLVFGLIYLGMGICGFVPAFVWPPPNRPDFLTIAVESGYGFLFGFLPTNVVHNLVYVLLGAGAILAAISYRTAVAYAKLLFGTMTLFVFLGVCPDPISRTFGLMPLFDFNVLLHLVTGAIVWYFGMIYPVDWTQHQELVPMRP